MLPEAEIYRARIADLRGQVRALVADLSPEALHWRPLAKSDDHATNSLAVLATHVAGAERFWIAEVVGGYPAIRDRAAEFAVRQGAAGELLDRLDQVGRDTETVLAGLSAADLDSHRQARDKLVPVRWAILHVVDHTALHLGHMQLTRQLWQGGRAAGGPRWFERLPPDG